MTTYYATILTRTRGQLNSSYVRFDIYDITNFNHARGTGLNNGCWLDWMVGLVRLPGRLIVRLLVTQHLQLCVPSGEDDNNTVVGKTV